MRTRLFPFLLFLLLLGFYTFTLQPALAWGDGIRLQREVISAESFILAEMVEAPFAPDPFPFARLGVAAWDHPLYVMMGHTLVRWLPGADPLWLVNFLSAIFGAGAVALLYQWLVGRTASPMAAAFAALALAVSHTFWWHAATPEVYTLFAFLQLLTIFLYDLHQRRGLPSALYGAAFTLGLGAANHLLALLLVPAAVVYALLPEPVERTKRWVEAVRRRRFPSPVGKRWLLAAVFFLLGFSPYLIQFLRMLRTFPLERVLGPAVGATFLRGSLATTPLALAGSGAAYAIFLLYQFNPAGVALGLYGWWTGRRSYPTLWDQAAAAYSIYLAFGLVYAVSDQFAFFLPAHIFWAVAMGMGAARLLARARAGWRRRLAAVVLALTAVVMVPFYEVAPDLLRQMGITEEVLGIPQIGTGVRDGLDYYLNPNRRGDTAAYDFGRETLQALPAEAVVIAEWYADTDEYFVFRYFAAIEGVRPDVEVVGWPTVDPFAFDPALVVEKVEAASGRRPVYLASLSEAYYGASTLAERYCIVAENNLYRLYPRKDAAGRRCVVPSPSATSVFSPVGKH